MSKVLTPDRAAARRVIPASLLVHPEVLKRRTDVLSSAEIHEVGRIIIVVELRGMGDRPYCWACGCGREALKPSWACEHINEALGAEERSFELERAAAKERIRRWEQKTGRSIKDVLAELGA